MSALPIPKLANSLPDLIGKSSVELFETVFSRELLAIIVEQNQQYAHRVRKCSSFVTAENELRKVLQIIILFGHDYLPRECVHVTVCVHVQVWVCVFA